MYAFVISGTAKIAGVELSERDGLGIWDTDNFDVEATSDAEILLMDVPMELPNM